jgi:predicted O-methyltransferase YrrM
MIETKAKLIKSLKAIKYAFLNPKKALIRLYEEHESNNFKHTFLNLVSFEQLHQEAFPEINFMTFLGGGSGPTDYLLLLLLASKYKEFDYLEIGTWRGESIRNILELQNCSKAVSITLDPSEYKSTNISIYETSNVLLDYNDKRLSQIFADSTKFDFSTLGKFDLIFIDGDHSYDAILSDTRNALGLLKDDSSVIVWHDYSYDNDHSVRVSTLNAIKEAVPKDGHQFLYYVENTMSAIYTKQKLDPSDPPKIGSYTKPTRYFSINLSINKLPIQNTAK